GWTEEDCNEFIRVLCDLKGDDEIADRLQCVRTTAQKLAEGANATGWQRLRSLLGDKTVQNICDWLGVGDTSLLDMDGPTRAFTLTEDGNSAKLIFDADGTLRYCPAYGWLE